MNRKLLTFGDIKMEKSKFSYHKQRIFLNVLDLDEIICNKFSSGRKDYK